jgi:predicted enzyme related to lactoylglutathione lyase
MTVPVPKIGSVVFDCVDADHLAQFWMELLDTEIATQFPGFIWLKPPHEGALSIAFQQVPDPTPGKNKLHLDAYHEDLEAVTDRVSNLGGSLVASNEVPGFVWNIYSDPEGNQFCIGHGVEPG